MVLYYILAFIFGLIIGFISFFSINKRKTKNLVVGYIKINLDDMDTRNVNIHWTNPNVIFNDKNKVIFDIKYVHEGIQVNREKK